MRTNRLMMLLAFGVLVGCAGGPEPVAEAEQPEGVDVSLTDCVEALRGIAQPTAQQAVDACAGIWKQPACRVAWKQAPSLPKGERPGHIVSACRQAYCPTMPIKTNLCSLEGTVDLSATQPPWMQYWGDFSGVVLASDLEVEPAPELAHFGRTLITLVALAE